MVMHTTMINTGISKERVYKKLFQTQHVHMGELIMVRIGNELVSKIGRSVNIMFRIENMYNTNQ